MKALAKEKHATMRRMIGMESTSASPVEDVRIGQLRDIAVWHCRSHNSTTKHLDIQLQFVRNSIEDGIIELRYCPTDVAACVRAAYSASAVDSAIVDCFLACQDIGDPASMKM
jgi:hypothetical protein